MLSRSARGYGAPAARRTVPGGLAAWINGIRMDKQRCQFSIAPQAVPDATYLGGTQETKARGPGRGRADQSRGGNEFIIAREALRGGDIATGVCKCHT